MHYPKVAFFLTLVTYLYKLVEIIIKPVLVSSDYGVEINLLSVNKDGVYGKFYELLKSYILNNVTHYWHLYD